MQTGTILYRKRRNDEYHFPNAQDHIQYNTSTILQVAIGAAVVGKVADALLGKGNAIADISKAITGGLGNITNMGIASILGQGMNPLNMVSMAGKLIPNIAGNVQSMVNGNLPKSALNVSKVGPAMSDFTKNQALLAQKKAVMKTALKPDIDSQLAAAQKKLADSQNAKNVTGTSEIINGQKVTYTATGATVSKV